mgnify:FL=1|tara:strand:- start:335 stop:1045 length:711 start_codon:yes stop_codon:yes gene_type:complete
MNNDDNENCLMEMNIPEPVEQPEEPIEEYVQEEQEEEEEEEVIIYPKEKEYLDKKDIFINTPSSKKKIIIPEKEEQVILKPQKKKRVMTEAQKENLAKARAKGMETRKRNADLRRQAKEQKLQEKEIVLKVRQKRVNKLKKELEEDDKPEVKEVKQYHYTKHIEEEEEVKPIKKAQPAFSQDDLNRAIADGIASYEKVRKERKSIKRATQEKDKQEKKIFNTITRAVPSIYDDCFN